MEQDKPAGLVNDCYRNRIQHSPGSCEDLKLLFKIQLRHRSSGSPSADLLEIEWQHLLSPHGQSKEILSLPQGSTDFTALHRVFLKFIWLHQVLVVAYGLFSFSMWDPVPRAGIESRPPALGAWSLSHWTTREVLKQLTFMGREPLVFISYGSWDHKVKKANIFSMDLLSTSFPCST